MNRPEGAAAHATSHGDDAGGAWVLDAIILPLTAVRALRRPLRLQPKWRALRPLDRRRCVQGVQHGCVPRAKRTPYCPYADRTPIHRRLVSCDTRGRRHPHMRSGTTPLAALRRCAAVTHLAFYRRSPRPPPRSQAALAEARSYVVRAGGGAAKLALCSPPEIAGSCEIYRHGAAPIVRVRVAMSGAHPPERWIRRRRPPPDALAGVLRTRSLCGSGLLTLAGVTAMAVTGELEQQVGLGGDEEHLAVDYGAMVWASSQGKVRTAVHMCYPCLA